MLASDNRDAWQPGLFSTNTRRVFSPTPDTYIIDDEIALPRAMSLSFRINSPLPIQLRGDGLVIPCAVGSVEVAPVGWTPAHARAGEEGIDCHLHPAYLGALGTAPTRRARLITVVRVLPAGSAGDRCEVLVGGTDRRGTRGGRAVAVSTGHGRLEVRELSGGRTVFAAVCRRGAWEVVGPGGARASPGARGVPRTTLTGRRPSRASP